MKSLSISQQTKVIALFVAIFLSGTFSQAQTPSLTIRQKTEKVIKAFEQEDFEAIIVYFDATMKSRLPVDGLKMTWLQITTTCGKFEKADMDNLKESRVDKYDVIEVPFFFAKEKLNLRLVFNSDSEISGLFLLPFN